MFDKWKKRKPETPNASEGTSLKQLGDEALRAKADECRAKVFLSPGFQTEFFPSGKNTYTRYPHISDEERTRLLLEEQSYLTEIDRREDTRVSRRDFRLEVAVIFLIAIEIVADFYGMYREGIEFNRQQTVLASLEKSSEATANTMVTLKKTMETMNSGIQNQLSLNYEVSVDLAMYRSSWTLGVTNRGRTSITLWGQKIDIEKRYMFPSPITVTPGETQDVDFASFFQDTTGKLAISDTVPTIPIRIFLRSENGQEYTAGCLFETEQLLGGSTIVHCQSTTVRASNWTRESR